MQIVKVSCQGCGAALKVDASDRMAVCGYCRTRMMIAPAETLNDMGKGLAASIEGIKLENMLQRLERQWQSYREATLKRSRTGELEEPSSVTAGMIGGLVGATGLALFVNGLAEHAIFVPVGIGVMVVAWFLFQNGCQKAAEYLRMSHLYQARRKQLLQQISKNRAEPAG